MRTLMMTMAMSSSREKPRSSRTAAASPCRRGQVPHRHEHAEGEDQHQNPHAHQQDRLDLGGEAFDFDGDLALVHVGDLGHQLVDFSRLLADRDHLQRSEEHTSDSSHGYISYAVFCLKKKKKKHNTDR